ncbi:MAG TPA: ABC transporter ATP-binding protein [Planctomycetaceae bacterium]|nr:ABC transporter ATP-binding protein [Planctomycetaceae bacterium]HQZ69110.1 ABC transporter ATP-binding protein [Planctomycetaceae bacterium]
MIRLENVHRTYVRHGQTVTALQCPELRIEAGEYVAVVGPSGSGKTTLLSLLGGMLSPTSGRIWLDDTSIYEQSVTARSAIRRERMGFVFQTFNLIPYLTALQNVQVPLGLNGVTPDMQVERATAMLSRFGLSDRLNHKPSELSVGQQQRVALARTLVNDPQIILADEPTGNLDPASREVVLNAFDTCHNEGRTIVMVTHDLAAATRAGRRLTLQDGTITEATRITAAA